MYLVVKLTSSRLKERDQPVHPFARSRRTKVRYGQRDSDLFIQFQFLPHTSSAIASLSALPLRDVSSVFSARRSRSTGHEP